MARDEAPVLFVGVDVGTSGVRACACEASRRVHAEAEASLPGGWGEGGCHEQEPADWWSGLVAALNGLAEQIPPGSVAGLAVDSTSGTLLLADGEGRPLEPALMYNDRRSRAEAETIGRQGPPESGAHGATSALAKLLHLHRRGTTGEAAYALHAADWLTARLTGVYGVSDENNVLKMGYDPVSRTWPGWVGELVPRRLLPEVVVPGARVGELTAPAARELGFPAGIPVRAGTTDSVAAFLATGAGEVGEAVTSLGSTLALKVVSAQPVFAPRYGVYSHRLGERWLPGGASNSGGAVLLQHFTREELADLTPHLRPEQPTGLGYRPLPGVGERFPENDPEAEPRLTPRPESRVTFLQGLLEGIAAIERDGYRRLAALGAPYPATVRTVGGGAKNPAWTTIRHRLLGVSLVEPDHQEAACGTARLAMGPVT
jgi:hypothetical protein